MRLKIAWDKNQNLGRNLLLQLVDKAFEANGDNFILALEHQSGLKFHEKSIEVLCTEGHNSSGETDGPLYINELTSHEDLMTVLTHELCHRLLENNGLTNENYATPELKVVMGHRKIYLFLYDSWLEAFGKANADAFAAQEREINEIGYREAWDWAQSKSYEERQAILRAFVTEKNKQKQIDYLK